MNKSPFENQFNKGKRISWLSIFSSLTSNFTANDIYKLIDDDSTLEDFLKSVDKINEYIIKKFPPENGEEKSLKNDDNEENPPY